MPPLGTPMQTWSSKRESGANSNVISVNVGGQIFQTTKPTLAQAGPGSLFSRLAESTPQPEPPFVDRDPELFSLLLSLLRSGNFPSRAKGRAIYIQDLIEESRFYGVESILINSLSSPSQFEALDVAKSLILPLNGRDTPSAIAATPHGALHVAHGGKITSFDWSLGQKSTILTRFPAVDSLLAMSQGVVAAGATDFPGLQIVNLGNGSVKQTLTWENVTRSTSTVQAIGCSPEYLFASFESSRRNSNCIMVYDLESLSPVAEIGRNEVYGADIDSAIPATKLIWVSSYGLVMASGSHSGPSGVQGHIKLWDVRSGNLVWEIKENLDCFSDVTVSDTLSGFFKVGVNSGEAFYADLRSLGAENPWICLGDGRKSLKGKKEGYGCRIESRGSHVFCTKGGDIEVWSEVLMSSSRDVQDGLDDRLFRKNLLDSGNVSVRNRITQLLFGGNKMFVVRKDQQAVEVWQSPAASRIICS